MIFTTDAIIGMIIMIIFLGASIGELNNYVKEIETQTKKEEIEMESIQLMDAIIKNQKDERNIGIAKYDVEKKRVKSNEIEKESIELNLEYLIQKGLTKMEIEYKNGTKELIYQKENETTNKETENLEKIETQNKCVGIERLTLIANQKAKIIGVFCE